MDRDYKGWRVEVVSYLSEGGRWRPDVRLWVGSGGTVRERSITAPGDKLFATERESDAYGHALAALWIDENG